MKRTHPETLDQRYKLKGEISVDVHTVLTSSQVKAAQKSLLDQNAALSIYWRSIGTEGESLV